MRRYYECPVCHTEEAVEVEVRGLLIGVRGRYPAESEITDNCCELTDKQRDELESKAFEDAVTGR